MTTCTTSPILPTAGDDHCPCRMRSPTLFTSQTFLPELDLSAQYASNGVGGTQFMAAGQKVTSSSVNQLFGFNYPTYYAQLSLSLPLKNRAAKAEMGSA